MASSRRTYDTDVITLRTVFAKNPGNSNVPALRTLTADGQGGAYWAVPSTLGVNPAFNQIITSGGTYTADLSYNTFRLTAAENIGMTDGPPGSNQTYLYAKAFSQFDVSGENSVYAFANNQLDSSVTFAGQGGITLRADPATNTLFFVGPASNTYVVSTGIYGFNQIKVVDAASSITSSIQTWQGNYLTATSPSTLLNFIGYNDIQMSTNVTTNSIFFTISTFTSKGYLDISANAYGAYPSTLSTVSSLYVQQSLFNSTVAYLSSYTGFGFSSVVSSINALAMSTGNQFYILTGLIDEKATLVQLNSYSNAMTNEMFSTTAGLGTLGYISTGGGGTIGSLQLISTVEGLGSAGYLSTGGGGGGDVTTAKLISTVEGLGTVGYVSSLSTIITSSIFNTGAISTYSLEVFGPATLTNSGSTILRGPIYLGGPTFIAGTVTGLPNTIVTPGNLNSTVQGLGTVRYISSTQLLSTVRGLGSIGYLSSLQGFAISSGSVTASSLNLLDPYTNDINYLTVSSGSLLVNGAKVGSNGGGSGGVAQIIAGTGISVSPGAGTGVVTITNTGASISYVDTAISSFSTALGPVTGGGGGGSYNFSTVSSVYGSTFVTNLLIASTMATANILPSQSNLWVAVGYGAVLTPTNSIQTSLDGFTWTDIASGGFSDSGKAVAYNGVYWVAVGNDTQSAAANIQYSGDGKNWSNSVSGGFSAAANGIAWNGSFWVAVGNDTGAASIKYSRNGRNWSDSSSGGFATAGQAIAWNGSYWVAVGDDIGTASIKYSFDGSNWVSASSGGFSTGGKGIAWNGSFWVAAGSGTATLQYSGDGRNWSNSVTGGFSSSGWRVAWNGKMWVAVGDDINPSKSIQTSIDGSNWSDIQTGGFAAGNDGYGIAWNGYFWVAAGIGGTAPNSLQRSTDGINWTQLTSGGFAAGGLGVGFSSNLSPGYAQQNLTILSQNIPLFLNSTNQIMAQPSSLVLNNLLIDTQWKRVGINCNTPAFDLDVNGIGHFLTLSSLGLNISSLNGANYPSILPSTVAGLGTIGFLSSLSNVTVVSTQQLLASSIRAPIISTSLLNTSSLTSVFLSSLAINASSITAPILSTLVLNVSSINGAAPGTGSGNGSSITVSTGFLYASSMAFVNMAQTNTNLWVVVGSGGSAASNIKYSYDGSNWSNSVSGGFTTQGYNVAWNGRLWVAVGQGGGTIKYSIDGLIWINASSGTFSAIGQGIAWNGRLWVAVGNRNTADADTIKYSTDGINWTNSASGGFSSSGLGIAWNGKIWLALGGGGGSIKYSIDGINWINNSTGGFSSSGRGIAWNGRIWVATGNNGLVAAGSIQYSTDGINWTNALNGGFSGQGWDIAWNGRMWVAVGSDPTTANTIQYSYDGINWSSSASGGFGGGGAGISVAWNGRLWVVSGGNNPSDTNSIKYSTDGINWTNNASGGFTTAGYGIAYSSNMIPSYNQTNFEIGPQNIPNFLTSTNQLSFLASTIIVNNTLFVDTTNRVGINTGTPQTDLDVGGIGRFFTASTLALNLSSINGANFATILPSTVAGLGSAGYVSTTSLVSTVSGLGNAGYVSTASLVSTVGGLGSTWFNSTIAGLGAAGYVSTTGLTSTVAGLGTIGFLSSLSNVGLLSTQQVIASSITAPIISTSLLNASSLTSVFLSSFAVNASSITAPIISTSLLNTSSLTSVFLSSFAVNASSITAPIISTSLLNVSSLTSVFLSSFAVNASSITAPIISTSLLNTSSLTSVFLSSFAVNASSITAPIISTSLLNTSSLTSVFLSSFSLNASSITAPVISSLAMNASSITANVISSFAMNASSITANVISSFALNTSSITAPVISSLAMNASSITANVISSFALNASSIRANVISSFAMNASSITGINVNVSSFFASSITNVNLAQTNTNLWIAVGSGGAPASIQYSTDGISWPSSSSGAFTTQGYGVGWNGRLWVAVGSGGASIKYSTDGLIWNNASGGFSATGRGVAWNGRIWVAVGNRNTADTDTIKYSADGISWTSASSGGFSTTGYGVAWNGEIWVAVGQGGTTIQYSTDGIFWTGALTNTFSTFGFGVAWNGQLWIAVGNKNSGITDTIKYSTDGINWTNINSGGFSSQGNGIAWNGRMWVAVGVGTNIQYSFDGINWLSASSSFGSFGFSVAWNGRLWVAVGNNSPTALGSIKYSTDGIIWTNNSSGGFTTEGVGVAYSANLIPSYNQTNFEIEPQNIPIFLRSTNTMSFLPSTIIANNTLFIDTTNRVGINTGNPQYALDVKGTSRSLYSTFTTNGTFNIASAVGGVADTGAANQLSLQAYNVAVATNLHLQPTGGNLGVGVPTGTAPAYTLDVKGTSRSLYSTFLINGNYGLAIASGGTADTGSANQTSIQGYNIGTAGAANLHLQPTGGNLGVGIQTGTAPSYALDVNGAIRASSIGINTTPDDTFRINLLGNIQTIGGGIFATSTTTNSHNALLQWNPGGYAMVASYVRDPAPLVRPNLAIAGQNNTNTRITAFFNNASSFVGIGTNFITPQATLDVNGSGRISTLMIADNAFSTGVVTNSFLLALSRDLALKPTTTTWTTSSDQRVKENIVDADYDRCYDDVKSLKLRRFTWASSFDTTYDVYDKRVLGFIAQEVSTIVPKAVTITEANGYSNFQFLNVDQLNMSLYGAVKKTIIDKEFMESTIKGQQFTIETLLGSQTSILSTLNGLQGR